MQSNKLNFNSVNNIFFIGVGGVSMSALCLMAKNLGKNVSGSDVQKNSATKVLSKNGIKVYLSHNANHINSNIDLVVYNGAIKPDNVELVKARSLDIKTITRGEFLGEVSSLFEKVVAISGTHGKSTTTSLVAGMFLACNVDVCAHIGANVNFLKNYYTTHNKKNMLNNFLFGKNVFVTEACEYKSNFLFTKNYLGVITNIEKEHLDYFITEQNELKEFEKFANNCKYLIVNYNLVDKLHLTNSYILTVDVKNPKADVYATNIKKFSGGGYVFDCFIKGEHYAKVVLNLIGEHNIFNCLCSLAVAHFFGLNKTCVLEFLQNFSGVARRMEFLGTHSKSKIYLDYAHHPTEIASTLKAIEQNIKSKNILIVFQPHTFSRTKLLFNDFVQTFCLCPFDVAFLPTYSAREEEACGLTSEELFKAVKEKKSNCFYFTKNSLTKFLKQNSLYSYIFFVGAGDLDKLASKLVLTQNKQPKI